MANIHMESMQCLYFLRLIQIKIIIRYHHTIVRMAKIKVTVNNKDKEWPKPQTLVMEMQNDSHLGKYFSYFLSN